MMRIKSKVSCGETTVFGKSISMFWWIFIHDCAFFIIQISKEAKSEDAESPKETEERKIFEVKRLDL